jgi:hypothetical protein
LKNSSLLKEYSMTLHFIKKVPFLLLFFAGAVSLQVTGCGSTGGLRVYKHVNSMSGESVRLINSPDDIDTEKAYEIYFRLQKPVDCIKLNITAKYIPDRFSGKKEHILAFFVLDQLIDLSRFSGPQKKYEISEIGRNFDSAWNRRRDLIICSGPGYPLLKLDEKTIYRLRFTTFRKVNFEYRIDLHADEKVIFIKKPEF